MQTQEQWRERLLSASETRWDLMSRARTRDVTGLGEGLQRLIAQGRSEWPGGVLLTGPSGSGKHHLARFLLQALEETAQCVPVFLSGDFLEEAGDCDAAAEWVNGLTDHFYDANQGLSLVLEEPEACPLFCRVYPMLAKNLQDYRDYADQTPPLFLVVIAREQPPLPAPLLEQLLPCPCALPDLAERKACLQDRGKMIRNYVSLELLAQMTEGCSYGELGMLAEHLGFWVDVMGRGPNEDELLRKVRQVHPAPAVPEVPAPERAVNTDRIAEALERLEGILSELSAAVSQGRVTERAAPQETKPKQSVTDQWDEADQRKQYEDMSVRDLSLELFGEERLQALLAN